MDEVRKERRGFASMDEKKQREIASKGGKAAHQGGLRTNGTQKKLAHEWTSEEAREAGRKGGAVSGKSRRRRRQPAIADSAPLAEVLERESDDSPEPILDTAE